MLEKDTEIKRLKEKLLNLQEDFIAERNLKESEIDMNRNLKLRIEEYKTHIQTLIKINNQYAESVAKLRLKLKDFIDNI